MSDYDNIKKESLQPTLWHHYTSMKEVVEKGSKVIVSGDGAIIRDFEGKEYIDGLSMLWVVNVGHNRREIVEAMKEQMDLIGYASLFGGYSNVPAMLAASKLKEIAPEGLNRVFFVSGGSEAVETAIKMSRQYFQVKGQGGRYKIIARKEAYHGVTLGALSATGIRVYRQPFEPLVPGFHHVSAPYCYRCEFNKEPGSCNLECAEAIAQAIEWEGPKTVAAVILEPVMNALGAIIPPEGYFRRVQEITRQYGVLLIIDEVVCAFGRLGAMFASEIFNIHPDMIVLAKGLTSGYAPLGAVLVKEELGQAFDDYMFIHGLTFGGHTLSTTATLKNIDVIQSEDLAQQSRVMGNYLIQGLQTLKKYRTVGDIRGMGLLTAIEYVADKNTRKKIPGNVRFAFRVEQLAWDRGLYLCRASVDKTYVAPPLVVSREQINKIIDILDESIGLAEKEVLG